MTRLLLFAIVFAGDAETLLDVKRPMEEREAAVKSLARTPDGVRALLKLVDEGRLPPELKATAAFACAATSDAALRAQAAERLPLPKAKGGKTLPPLAVLAALKGDAGNGAKVFRRPEGPNCIGCHQINEEGKLVGPPLSTIGNKLGREQLLESILTPSAALLMSYENWAVRTKDGEVKTGLKVEDTDDHLTLKDTNGEYIDIPVAKIADKKMLTLSMMPENITEAMTVQELVDVIEYLQTLR
jgi:putative heme-binding domain-containing protein